jgi:8-oxo-dGTP pyrophosphatase MutT (NUDIX family)
MVIEAVRRDACNSDPRAAAAALLARWQAPDAGQARLRQRFLDLLAARVDALSRACVPAHLTASALVVDPGRERVLLTLHPKVGAWVPLGGHCELTDVDLQAAALREATEESGIDGLTVDDMPIDLDAHEVGCLPGGGVACHLDVRFVVTAPADAEPRITAESLDLAWWPVAALPEPVTGDLARLLGRLTS